MSDKFNTEQLVRTRLGDAELTPSPETWKGILRKLRWRQFLRFNPGKFNIYYAGVILLAGTGLALMLIGDEAGPEPLELQDEIVISSPQEVNTGESSIEPGTVKKDEEISKPIQASEAQPISKVEPSSELDAESIASIPEVALKIEAENALVKTNVSPLIIEPNVEKVPITYFASSVQTGCAPLEVRFVNHSVNATSYKWTFGTGEESDQQDPVYIFKEAGRYTVTLTAENHGGKATVSRRMIEVLPQPVADFQIEEGMEGTDNHVVLNLLNYSSSASSYSWCLKDEKSTNCSQWSSLEFQPSIKLNQITPDSRSVQLQVVSDNGCRDTATVDLPLRVETSDVKIKFATAFSPNPSGPGDGSFSPQSKRIDLFHPVYVEIPVEYRMRVFTRRGELVFETQEVFQGWDGYVHQEQAAGDVYVWMVEGRWANGQPFSYHGDVTLVRNQYW